jgi:uncharacterized protein YdcH (DUF465 family)
MNKEKIEHHISHLQEKHDELDARVTNAEKTHGNEHVIKVLKKEKLALKDEIEGFKKQLA